MKLLFAFSILLSIFSQSLSAYPISPQPLRMLITGAEDIVFASVVKIEKAKTEKPWNSTKAILLIKERLKGESKGKTIEVFFTPGMICPAPATYEKGTTVLAFLRKNEKMEGYYTHALSYGSKTLDNSEYQVYRKRIIEMKEILEIKNKKEQEAKTINWFVSCAAHPVTRWEGTYELSPQSDFMSFYDVDEERFTAKHLLSEEQITSLRKSLFAVEKIGYSEIGLFDLVAKKGDKELLDFLIKDLKYSDIKTLWYRDFIMERIVEFSGRKDLSEILDQIQNLEYSDDQMEGKATKLSLMFVEKL